MFGYDFNNLLLKIRAAPSLVSAFDGIRIGQVCYTSTNSVACVV